MRLTILTAAALTLGLASATPALAQSGLSPDAAAEEAEFESIMAELERDPVAARARIEARAATGDPEYLNLLGVVLRNADDATPADIARADALQRQAAAAGSDAARLNLGTALLTNDDLSDDAEGVAALNAVSLAELRPFAAYPLGRAYLFGHGAPQDLGRGSTLILQAAAASPDNSDARFLAGRALRNGWGVPRDLARARAHFLAAAEAGDPRAQWNLGMMLLQGEGGPEDARAAYGWVRKAAELGHIDGQISLAVMLALGQGVAPDPAQARVWYGKAAEAGSAHALRGLGMMLLTGEGGAADPVVGAAYLELAAEAGEPNAANLRRHFSAQIASLDRAAIDKVKADWIARRGPPFV